MADAPTTLALYDAKQILDELMTTRNRTLCCICSKKLGTETYLICRFPEAAADTRGMPEEHEGHTACKACVVDRDYVGEKASCKACFSALGGRRSSLIKAGIALIPPVRNTTVNTILTGFEEAEKAIREGQEAVEHMRIRESVDRRCDAQDAAARKRGFEDRKAELAHRERIMSEAKDAEEDDRFQGGDWDDYVIWKDARDKKVAAAALKAHEATTEKLAAARKLAAAQTSAAETSASSSSVAPHQAERGRGFRAPVSRQEREERLTKARRTREANKEKKQKLENYEQQTVQLHMAERKLDELWRIAKDQVVALGGDPAGLINAAHERFAEVEEEVMDDDENDEEEA